MPTRRRPQPSNPSYTGCFGNGARKRKQPWKTGSTRLMRKKWRSSRRKRKCLLLLSRRKTRIKRELIAGRTGREFSSSSDRRGHYKIVALLCAMTIDAGFGPARRNHSTFGAVVEPVPVTCLRVVAFDFQHHHESGEFFACVVIFRHDK